MSTLRPLGRDWEATLRGWSKPSSNTEDQKREHAESMVRDAIEESGRLGAMNIEVFAQGSYRNNTEVRVESDVDICVVHRDVYFPDYSFVPGVSNADVGLVTSEYSYSTFKTEVGKALVTKFGSGGVTRGNKAFDVH